MKAEEFLDNNFIPEYYQGEVFGDFAYPRATVIEVMEKYAEEVLKIAAEKAILKGERDCEYYEFYRAEDDVIRVNEESILNCLKE